MKIIQYTMMRECNRGTEEKPNIVQTFSDCEIKCPDDVFESNYAIAQSEAYGEIIVEDIPDSPEEQIASLKAELESTDYKIIKCSEAQMVGEELPYDIVALHAERQALRDRINELEEKNTGEMYKV